MIRGYFKTADTGIQRPFIDAVFQFPTPEASIVVPLLVDTGADRTMLSPLDTNRLKVELGIDHETFELGIPSTGVGGRISTRVIDTVLRLNGFETSFEVTVLPPPESGPISPIPSLLGRDIISRFRLFVDQGTERVLLLEEEDDVKILNLP